MFGGADTIADDARVLGLEIPESEPFLLWAQHLDLYVLMRHASRQLRVAPMGGVIGFDIPAIKMIAEGLDVAWSKTLITQLMQFEAMAVELFNKGAKS